MTQPNTWVIEVGDILCQDSKTHSPKGRSLNFQHLHEDVESVVKGTHQSDRQHTTKEILGFYVRQL